jgi:hypothetical protein
MKMPEAIMWKILATALMLIIAAPTTASAVYLPFYFQTPFQTFPECTDPGVSSRIISRFNWADKHTWYRGVGISNIDGQYERSVVAFGPYPIYRRYCRARAWLSNNTRHTVYYRIERGMGLAGTGYKVEFCIAGYDPWRVYNGGCRVLSR